MNFSERIKELRVGAGMSVIEFAKKMNKSESAIRMWETGKNKPDADTLTVLSRMFGCTTDYLLGVDDFKNKNEKDWFLSAFNAMEISVENLKTDSLKDFIMTIERIASLYYLNEHNESATRDNFLIFTDFIRHLADFYATWYSIYRGGLGGTFKAAPKDGKEAIRVLLIAAFELKDMFDSFIYEKLGLDDGKESQFTIDYNRYKKWTEIREFSNEDGD